MKCKSGHDIDQSATLLKKGCLVAIPTETVYGLAANAFDTNAVARIFEAKKRPSFDPLIVHCGNLEMVNTISKNIPNALVPLLQRFWPGPLTIVVDKNDCIPDIVTSGYNTVGIRIPNHPLTLRLLNALDFPLAAPSANPFTYVSPTSAQHVCDQLGDEVDYILDGGECSVGLESTIVRVKNDIVEVLRLGGLAVEEIEKYANYGVHILSAQENVAIPGNFKKHYSNRKAIILSDVLPHGQLAEDEALVFFRKPEFEVASKNTFYLSESGSLPDAASNLFKILRLLDNPDIRIIHAQWAPNHGLGLAINDRLRRASNQ